MLDPDTIGSAAGAIWNRLREMNGEGCSVSSLKKTREFTNDEVAAGIGWLAREGKIDVLSDGRKVVLRLAQAEMQC